ncbi:MAG: folylpolyglutamate synthase/dihydrofolate synthase family protein [Hyphomicrobiaceae bacterium]|nr:folylpolyglutamate synthase/dihydrofolate synthase family protein [Hyphomicrobiaceae bacterium]
MRTSDELLAELRQLHPLRIDLSLGRIERLLAALGSPHAKLPPTAIIAGTNGKGSTTAFLKAMLEAAGKRVHVYTSPHLVRFAERIQVPSADGRARPIPEDRLVEVLERVARVNAGAEITFFEITTAAAFLAFHEIPADAVLLEVGLGGRLDTTNVVPQRALSIITPVSMDHAEMLGPTVPLIAREKAGILRPGVTAIIAQQTSDAMDAIRAEADRVRAPLVVWGEAFEAFEQRTRLVYQDEERLLDLPLPALIGAHQIVNAGTAVAAALRLPVPGISERAIERGLTAVAWPARMQRLDNGPLPRLLASSASELWLDGGHNVAGGAAIAETLGVLEERAPKPLAVIVGMMGRKDARGFLENFRGLTRRVVTVPVPGTHEATFDPVELAAVAASLGLPAEPATDIADAIRRAQEGFAGAVRILVCGSLYVAGHVLSLQEGVAAQAN